MPLYFPTYYPWRTNPPAGTRLQPNHPLGGKDCYLWIPFNDGIGQTGGDISVIRDYSGRRNHGSRVGANGSIAMRPGRYGLLLDPGDLASSGQYISFGTAPVIDSDNEPFTVCCRFQINSLSTSIRVLYNLSDAVTSFNESFLTITHLAEASTRGDIGFGWENTLRTYNSGDLSPEPAQGVWYDWVIIFDDPGNQNSDTAFTSYFGRVEYPDFTETAFDDSDSFVDLPDETTLWNTGSFPGDDLPINALAVYRRAFTPQEVQMWHVNPWQGFYPDMALSLIDTDRPVITDVANSGETPGSGSETWDDGSSGNVITGTNFL